MYVEDVKRFELQLNAKQTRLAAKNKQKDISNQIMQRKELEDEQRRLQKHGSYQPQSSLGRPHDNSSGPLSRKFNFMDINELKQHESGILNLFEGKKELSKYVSHNKVDPKTGKPNRQYVRLTQREYQTIFDRDPTFNEKKAVVDQFRRKWKEDKGYCSMFDKRKDFKEAR